MGVVDVDDPGPVAEVVDAVPGFLGLGTDLDPAVMADLPARAQRRQQVQQMLGHRDRIAVLVARQVADLEIDRAGTGHAALRSLLPE